MLLIVSTGPMLGEAPVQMSSTQARLAAKSGAERILVIRLGAFGDVLRTLPSVAALRGAHPGSHLCWLVEAKAEPIVAFAAAVDEILVFPRGELVEACRSGGIVAGVRLLRRFLADLRARRFDLVVDFHGLAKSALLALLSGSRQRAGYVAPIAREGSSWAVNRPARLRDSRVSRYVRNAALVESLVPGVRVPEHRLLFGSAAVRDAIGERVHVPGSPPTAGYVLIHPGSSAGAPHKRYPVEGWRTVARMLARNGVSVWIARGASPAEQVLAASIVEGAGEGVVLAPMTDRFDELVAVVERAAVFCAADTGPLHAATLCGVPVVQLLGPTDPGQNEPGPASRWRRVHVGLPCSPCRRGCADAACMRAIEPERVVAAILALRRPGSDGSPRSTGGRGSA